VDHVIDAHARVYADTDLDDQVNRMCLADSRMFMAGLNLTYTDRASMAASCEVRVPFVDPVVFEAAFALPGSEKIRRRTQKAALKDVARAWLPDAVIDEHAAIYDDNALDDEVNRMCLADTRLFMAGLNLTYTDRASMAASVEVRVPFVDKVVAQAAFTIPGSRKIRGRQSKAALKDAAETWLPREIVHRPKASFGAPLRAWVRNDLRELINDVLVGGELVQAGTLRRQALLRLIADDRAGREDYAKQIWQLLSMELWYRQVRGAGVAG